MVLRLVAHVAVLWIAAQGRASAAPAVQVMLLQEASSPPPLRPHLRRALAETGCAAYTAESCLIAHPTCALQLCGFAYVNGTTVAWHDQTPHVCVDYTAATQTCSNSTPVCPVGTRVTYPIVGGNSYTVSKERATGATPTAPPTKPPTNPAPAPAPGPAPAPAPTGSSAGTIAVTVVVLVIVFLAIAGAAIGGVLIYIKVILPKQSAGNESLLAGGAAAPRKSRKKRTKKKGANDPFGGSVDSDPFAPSGGGGGRADDSGSEDESDGGATFKAKKKKKVKRDKGSPFDL